MKTKVTYTVSENIVRNTNTSDNWCLHYELLSEQDCKVVATVWNNMKVARFNKLVNHTSKKFVHMRTRKVWVTKIFHQEEVETVGHELQLRKIIDELLKSTK